MITRNYSAFVLLLTIIIGVCTARPEGAIVSPLIASANDEDSSGAAASYVLFSQQHPNDATLIGTSPPPPPPPDVSDADDDGHQQDENTAAYWRVAAQATLREHLNVRLNTQRAKNVIFFMGDGMSLPTVTAARMYLGQRQGNTGEEAHLSFEQFPHVGLSKTYCVNKQTADSACSATAYLCGVKANFETIGVTGAVQRDNCSASLLPENRVASIVDWAQTAGKRTGVVTTTRITHASPTGAFGHTANRNWESDADLPAIDSNNAVDAEDQRCEDIAAQLIRGQTGRRLNVIFGGGRRNFLPANTTDADGVEGVRLDGVDLIEEWRAGRTPQSQYLRNRADLLEIIGGKDGDDGDVLGLFAGDHLSYYLDADHEEQPTLSEMTEAAIHRLKAGPSGFFLFVEGGRIDHAHHENRARKALEETVQFSDAIRRAVELSGPETLIVVTSDHAHTMSISGYSKRGDDILGLNTGDSLPMDQLRYTTLAYGTGPRLAMESNGSRTSLEGDDFADKDYVYPALVPMRSAAHGGDDVGVFAVGPWSHLFAGVYEQNAIPHMMGYASCLGDGLTVCDGGDRL